MLKRMAAWVRSVRWVLGVLAAVVVALAIAWVLLVPTADWLATHDVGQVGGALRTMRLQTARDAARGRLLTLAAGLFAVAALVYTARNFTLSREGQVTDRYTKAIEQLGSDKLDVRIGGIYALERIARDSARDFPTVMEVLAAFVREHSRERWLSPPPNDPGADASERTTRPDVQAAVTVIGRRSPIHDRQSINLAGADLTGADLTSAYLTQANLSGAYLTHANLASANLARAHLYNADLTGANLAGANLSGAYLTHANLSDAHVIGANLNSAYLTLANLTGAILVDADLTSALLTRTDLAGAHLAGANLTGANLKGASWPMDTAVPDGWRRDTDSGCLMLADTNSGGRAAN